MPLREKVWAHYFPDFLPIFQHHHPRSLCMYSLFSVSLSWPLSLSLKVLATNMPLQPFFLFLELLLSSGFSYWMGSFRANLVAIAITAAAVSSLTALKKNIILTPPPPHPPMSPSSFPFRIFFALSDSLCLFFLVPLSLRQHILPTKQWRRRS